MTTAFTTASTLAFDEALAALAALGTGEPASDREFRCLARALHPDAAPPGRRDEATAAFARLTAARRRHRPVLTTGRHSYTLGATFTTGDLTTLRHATYDDEGTSCEVLLKIPLDPADNDLTHREARALTTLATTADPRHRAYAPTLVESFRHRDEGGTERRVNVLRPLTGFRTLAEVEVAYPGGVDPRDAAWMWRRLLVALGWAHRAGLVHGAVLPEHVLIHPERHGLVLVDWCYATAVGETVPALVSRHRDLYPPEVPGRRPATPATDLHLASTCVARLTRDLAPRPMRAFLRGCLLPAEARRPHDAWRLLAELDDLLDRLYGPRVFRPFHLPAA
ncbi:molecular chaperone DnaJ [Streptantibioticus parmotrematis]|uniref:molecular chaperone DnaJ n=1 Tax=Streptantibioticus parmotrematis TaxID=2873249 RepID=UPI0033D5862F